MRFLILILIFSLFYRCDDNRPITNQFTRTSACKYCHTEYFIYPTAIKPKTHAKNIIEEPVAIEFFNVNDTLEKTFNKRMDSLPAKFVYKDMRGQQLLNNKLIIYYIEQKSIYQTMMQPFLDSIGVKQIKGNYKDSFLTFKYKGKPYTVDITYFKDNDGVIFFKPGKKPIYWQQSNFKEGCQYRDFANCYFNNNNN